VYFKGAWTGALAPLEILLTPLGHQDYKQLMSPINQCGPPINPKGMFIIIINISFVSITVLN